MNDASQQSMMSIPETGDPLLGSTPIELETFLADLECGTPGLARGILIELAEDETRPAALRDWCVRRLARIYPDVSVSGVQ